MHVSSQIQLTSEGKRRRWKENMASIVLGRLTGGREKSYRVVNAYIFYREEP